jgi:hypothetical protein
MKVNQLSVFIQNRSGRLAAITTALGEMGINIRAMALEDNSEFGIFRLIVDDTDKARQLLKDRGFAVRLSEVVAVEIGDTPGSLGTLLSDVRDAGINVDYMYAFVQKNADLAVIILRFDDPDAAITAMQQKNYTLLSDRQLAEL